MNRLITKKQLREALGYENDNEVAAFFEISPSAVCQWPEDGPVPELRLLQAAYKRPGILDSIACDVAPDDSAKAA